MRTTTLFIQAGLVLGLTAFVGYPEFRQPTRGVRIWRADGPLTPRPELVAQDNRLAFENGSLRGNDQDRLAEAENRRTVADRTPIEGNQTVIGRSTITGRVRSSLNQAVPFARLVLRNLATGLIDARATTDETGQFSFLEVPPSGYVVELVGVDGLAIAASDMIVAGGGTIQRAVVRLGASSTPRALFGTVGGTTTGTTTGTTRGITGGGDTTFIGATASEPINRAAETGAGQTTEPDTDTSPRT